MKKCLKAMLLIMAILVVTITSGESEAATAGWKKDSKGYYYQFADGTYAKSEYIDGYWLDTKGYWTYKFKASWKKNSIGWWYGDTNKWYAKNQWMKINSKWYHFNKSGYLDVSKWIGSSYVDANGVWDKTKKLPATHTHSYTSKVTKAATCTTVGTKTYTCSCGDSYTETIKATGHKFGKEWHTTVQTQEQITEKVTYYIGDNGYNFNDHGYTTKKQVQDKINHDLENNTPMSEGGCGCFAYSTKHKTIEIQPAKYRGEYYHTCETCGYDELIRTVE